MHIPRAVGRSFLRLQRFTRLGRALRQPVSQIRLCSTAGSGTADPKVEEVEAEATIDPSTAAGASLDGEKEEEEPMQIGTHSGELKSQSFQAETRQLLQIVSKSLYTDREIFIRELLSNASDALEKMRYLIKSGNTTTDETEHPLEMVIRTDKAKNTLTISDTGVGMNAEELASNLGTIARSGSRSFLSEIGKQEETPLVGDSQKQMENIIGMFGVGFYSAFMVADKIEVYSKSFKEDHANYWVSDGYGEFSIAPAKDVARGTTIILHLKDDATEFSDRFRVETVVKKYSAYLMFPIKLNRSLVTSTGALWAKAPKDVEENEHKEFYQLLANAYDDPYYIFHSHFENVKYSVQSLFYVPPEHTEAMGSGRLDPGTSVYSRKVLIKPKCREILPDWLRFVKGVVDSENIPLHISREELQDSKLIEEINTTLMLKIVDYLKRQAKKDNAKYVKWYEKFAGFIKEGVCTEYKNRRKIAELLRFESNTTPAGTLISLDEYMAKMKDDQKDIYYLVAPDRGTALSSPYMEAFEDSNTQVLLGYAQIDDFCFQNLQSYRQKELVSAEKSAAPSKNKNKSGEVELSFEEAEELINFLKKEFPKKLDTVTTTDRLKTSPAILIDHMSQSVRFYLRSLGEKSEMPPQKLQVNPSHPVIKGLHRSIATDRSRARVVGSQLINNAFIAAGLVDDAREMLHNINDLMAFTLNVKLTPRKDDDVPAEKPEEEDAPLPETPRTKYAPKQDAD